MRHIQCTNCHGSFVVDNVPADRSLKCPFCGRTELSIPVPEPTLLSDDSTSRPKNSAASCRPGQNPWSAAVGSLTGLCLGQIYNSQLRKASTFLSAHIAVQSLLAVGAAWSESIVWYWLMLGVLLSFVLGTAADAFVSAVRGTRYKLAPSGAAQNLPPASPPEKVAQATDSIAKEKLPKSDQVTQASPGAKPCNDDVANQREPSPPAREQ